MIDKIWFYSLHPQSILLVRNSQSIRFDLNLFVSNIAILFEIGSKFVLRFSLVRKATPPLGRSFTSCPELYNAKPLICQEQVSVLVSV